MGVIENQKVLDNLFNNEVAYRNSIIRFIVKETRLEYDEADFLVGKCEDKNLDIFLVLGLIKVESNFNSRLVGSQGERGLGQLMENTAKPLAKNMDINYDPELLFKPEYNITLFTTQLEYLTKYLSGDIHKILTAYNRGQYGLKKYMASRGSRRNPAQSIYSDRVLQYASYYSRQYNNEDKITD